MDLVQHLPVIWRRRWLVLGISLGVALLVFAASATRPKVYRADAVLRVPAGPATSDRFAEQTLFLARTYAELATTRPVLADAVRRSGLPVGLDDARRRVRATADNDVGFIRVTATGPSRPAAETLATAVTDAVLAAVAEQRAADRDVALRPLREQAAAVERELAGAPPDDPKAKALEVRYAALLQALADEEARPTDIPAVVSPARADDAPVSPRPMRNAVLALLVALVVNGELMVLIEARSDRFATQNLAEDVNRVTGLPVLAEVPLSKDAVGVEEFYTLRTNLLFVGISRPIRTVLLTSVGPGAGKSYCALGLARSAGDFGLAVTLVDGDLRRPVLHTRLGVPRLPGLSELLAGASTSSPVVSIPGHGNLALLPAGAPAPDPSGLVSGRLAPALDALAAELLIIDTPPASLFADAVAMAFVCDATIIVIDAATTRRRAVRRLVDELRRVGANPVGVVVNKVSPSRPGYYYYATAGRDGAADPGGVATP